MKNQKRLVVLSNRLPVKIEKEDDTYKVKPGAGGLVTAFAPVLRDRNGLWIGWSGTTENIKLDNLLSEGSERTGYTLIPVNLPEDDLDGYYNRFSNGTLWPLFHDLLGRCEFEVEDWKCYQRVNRIFSEKLEEFTKKDDFIWIQDYHLFLVAKYLKERNIRRKTNFFLHIPFPPLDIFIKLPWRWQILEGILSYYLVGFQTERDRQNFIRCVNTLLPKARINRSKKIHNIVYNNNVTKVGVFPIGIDFYNFNNLALSKQVQDEAWYLHEKYQNQKLILGVDRLDFTKGIPEKFKAFATCLEKYPELKEKISLLQIIVPSRIETPIYMKLKQTLDELVGFINGRFAKHGWIPINYMYRRLDRKVLVSHYFACEIALITPLKDGMNLVAKEYCASCPDNRGVLILSEFAGAVAQLHKGAILVNPYDYEGIADAIHKAYFMSDEERNKRMNILRSEVKRNNVFKWVDNFIRAAISGEDYGSSQEFYSSLIRKKG
ncbi:trehalose-6-phosphate synthase [candidate division KSB1 bacterium]|nr:MAG: trehalose-6-phosphate synthase [candidate division KSB1 bacterium]